MPSVALKEHCTVPALAAQIGPDPVRTRGLVSGSPVVRSPNHFVQLANVADSNREVGASMRKAGRTRGAP